MLIRSKYRCLAVFGTVLGVMLAANVRAQDVTPDDQALIQALSAQYAQALGACDAETFADLFAPDTGYFASGFRGHFEGREQLIKLVESERHCTAGPPPAGRGGGNSAPTALLYLAEGSVHGLVQLGTADYQDEYTKTPAGWRFASRTVVIAGERDAGLDARDMLAINRLGGSELAEYYEDDPNGVPRLLTVGTRIAVADGKVTGRVFLEDGSYRDEVYEETLPGRWHVVSATP